jgi:hypothetical protein
MQHDSTHRVTFCSCIFDVRVLTDLHPAPALALSAAAKRKMTLQKKNQLQMQKCDAKDARQRCSPNFRVVKHSARHTRVQPRSGVTSIPMNVGSSNVWETCMRRDLVERISEGGKRGKAWAR